MLKTKPSPKYTPVTSSACDKQHYEVTNTDLPLSCPMPNMRLWDAHPRVYLEIEHTGHVTCPYCSAEFILKNETESHGQTAR